MQKTRKQISCLTPRNRAKTMKKATRSPFLAPFRVDRATAMSDIVVRAVTDDLRHSTAAAAHKMSVYA